MLRSTLKSSVELLRPVQWLKNLMLFFPPFLGGTLPAVLMRPSWLLPFICFCLASSATYIFNDLNDRRNDLNHPEKRLRPLPSGRISIPAATLLMLLCGCIAPALAWTVSGRFCMLLVAYVVVSAAYSLKLKEYPVMDIFCISAGFLLRLESGGAAYGVVVSEWLFLSVFFLALFLSAGKRLAEKSSLGSGAGAHRKVLTAYPDGVLEGSMYLAGSAALVTYTMYVITRHSSLLRATVPLCCFGLLRYLLQVRSGKNGDPTLTLTGDPVMLAVGTAWAVLTGCGIYGQ
jgi:4-hydroxybenzoate polyprenyltransferase